eukprot:794242-Alexandrium_andersonii.AAC.1
MCIRDRSWPGPPRRCRAVHTRASRRAGPPLAVGHAKGGAPEDSAAGRTLARRRRLERNHRRRAWILERLDRPRQH